MSWRVVVQLPLLGVLLLILAVPARAQDPPTTPLPKTPEDTNGKTAPPAEPLPEPPMPSTLKKAQDKVQKSQLFRRLRNHEDGWYPRALSLTTGASWSAGLGYRKHVIDDRAVFDASGEYSIRGYRLLQTSLEFSSLPHRLYLRGDARYRHFPQEDFFGLGGISRKSLRTTFLLRTNEAWGTLGMRVRPTMTTGVEFGWMHL